MANISFTSGNETQGLKCTRLNSVISCKVLSSSKNFQNPGSEGGGGW